MALDQLVFQDQRFQLGVGDDPFQVSDLAHEAPRLGVAIGLEIRPNAVAQHHRLADVDHGAVGRTVNVDPRPLGQGIQFLGELGGEVSVHSTNYSRTGRVEQVFPLASGSFTDLHSGIGECRPIGSGSIYARAILTK